MSLRALRAAAQKAKYVYLCTDIHIMYALIEVEDLLFILQVTLTDGTRKS